MHSPLTGDEILALQKGLIPERLVWLPDSSRIICKAQFGGQAEFWSIKPDTGEASCLTMNANGSMPAVSPDGRWLSYLQKKANATEVWLWPLDPKLAAVPRQLTNTGVDINSAAWAPDAGAMAFACNRTGTYNIYEVRVSDGEIHRVTHETTQHTHYPVYSPAGRSIFCVRLNHSWEDHDVIEIARDGSASRVVANDRDFFDYQFGRRFGYPLISPDGTRLLFRSHRSNWINYWKVLLSGAPSDQVSPVALIAEPHDQGAESGSIYAGDAAWSPDGRHVAYVSNREGNIQLRVVPTDGGVPVIVAAGDEGVACQPAWSPDGTRLAFLYYSFTKPPDLWVSDVIENHGTLEFSAPRQLTQSAPEYLKGKLTRPSRVRIKTFDGQMLHGYVYQPRNARPQPGPGIVQVQGGPVDQFRDMLDIFAQYFVSRGYVCLLVQRRGSMGFGKDFEEGIRGGWGVEDLKDLIAGARYLASERLADGKRVGLTGESYGGYVSMLAAVAAPEGVFAAIVSRTGYADWGQYVQHGHQRTIKLLTHSMGSYEANKEKYDRSAAINKAHMAATPIFVVDEDADVTAPHPHLRIEFVRALRRYDKPVVYERYASTGGPGVSSEAGAKKMLPDIEQFFRQHLG